MRLLYTGAILLGFFFTEPPLPQTLPSPPMSGTREEGAALAKTPNGTMRWKNVWTMERTTVDNRRVIHFTENGEGVHSPFTQEVRWTTLSWWTDDGAVLPLRSESTYTDVAGEKLVRETQDFDRTRNQVRFDRQDLKTGKTTTRTLTIPRDTLAVYGIAGVLRALPFLEGKPVTAHMLTNEPKVYEVSFEMRGKEEVQTATGRVECYKVEVVPHLGVLNVFRFLAPKTYFWFSVDAPHTWIRYEGLENGPGTPEIVMEARIPS